MDPKDLIIARLRWWLEDISYKAPEQITFNYADLIGENFTELGTSLFFGGKADPVYDEN